jgi:hypothetical protein
MLRFCATGQAKVNQLSFAQENHRNESFAPRGLHDLPGNQLEVAFQERATLWLSLIF